MDDKLAEDLARNEEFYQCLLRLIESGTLLDAEQDAIAALQTESGQEYSCRIVSQIASHGTFKHKFSQDASILRALTHAMKSKHEATSRSAAIGIGRIVYNNDDPECVQSVVTSPDLRKTLFDLVVSDSKERRLGSSEPLYELYKHGVLEDALFLDESVLKGLYEAAFAYGRFGSSDAASLLVLLAENNEPRHQLVRSPAILEGLVKAALGESDVSDSRIASAADILAALADDSTCVEAIQDIPGWRKALEVNGSAIRLAIERSNRQFVLDLKLKCIERLMEQLKRLKRMMTARLEAAKWGGFEKKRMLNGRLAQISCALFV